MITILIVMIVGSIIGFKSFPHIKLKLKLGNALFGATLGLLVGFFLALFINCFVKGEYETITSTQIEVLKDNSGVSGSFILGCGTIENTMFYAFYQKNRFDEYTLKTIECKNAVIKNITDGSEPRLESQMRMPTTTFGKLFTVPNSSKSVFFIPEGSIKTGFVLDAQ